MADKWRPIKTAPKDGTEVWIGAEGRVILAYVGHKRWRSAWSQCPLAWEPTHWQPFHQPKPPA